MSRSLFFSFFELALYGGMLAAGKCCVLQSKCYVCLFKKHHAREKDCDASKVSLSKLDTWNSKQPFFIGCFSWMIPNLYIKNGCFTKHPLKTGCLGFQVRMLLVTLPPSRKWDVNGSSLAQLSPLTTLKKDGANDAEEHLHLLKKSRPKTDTTGKNPANSRGQHWSFVRIKKKTQQAKDDP